MQRKNEKPGKRGKRRVGRVKQVRAERVAAAERDASEREPERVAEPINNEAVILGPLQTGDTAMSTNQNTVEVDESQLAAIAQSAVDNAPVIDGAPPAGELVDGQTVEQRQPTPEEVLKGYVLIATPVVEGIARTAAPNWKLAPEKKTKLAEALAQAAVLWFPDQVLPPKWAVLLVVADAVMEIAADNYDAELGDYRPLKLKNVTPTKNANPAKTEAV